MLLGSGLLLGSFALDCWFWLLGDPRMVGPPAVQSWLSFAAWLGGVLLLPADAVLALRSPVLSLRDRLVGPYLTPR
jgi:hypothetical protein